MFRKNCESFRKIFEVFVSFFVPPFVQRFLKNISRRCDCFGPKIVKIRAILAICRPFEVFAGVRYLFGCFEVHPGRKELEIYSVRDVYDSTIRLRKVLSIFFRKMFEQFFRKPFAELFEHVPFTFVRNKFSK